MSNKEGEQPSIDTRYDDLTPIGRFLLRNLDDIERDLIEQHGSNYSSLDLMKHPKAVMRGVIWYMGILLLTLPEEAYLHLKALAQGFKDETKPPSND